MKRKRDQTLPSKTYVCTTCNTTWNTPGGLANHRRFHTGNITTCKVCGFQSDIKSQMDRSHNQFHKCHPSNTSAARRTTILKCTKCDWKGLVSNMKKHMSSHGGFFVTCEFCGKTGDTKELFRHRSGTCIKNMQKEKKNDISCHPHCAEGKEFRRTLMYPCTLNIRPGVKCTYTTSNSGACYNHMKGHSNQLYTCEYDCGYTSNVKTQFKFGSFSYHGCKEGYAARAIANVHSCTKCSFTR